MQRENMLLSSAAATPEMTVSERPSVSVPASVTQLEMMPKAPDQRAENNPWPEWPKICKTDYGQEEAIAVFGHDPRIYQTTVTEFIKNKKGEVCQIKTVKLTPKKDEKVRPHDDWFRLRWVRRDSPGRSRSYCSRLFRISVAWLGESGRSALVPL